MTGQCPWPSGIHNYRAGKCTRCGYVETPEPVAARTVSDVAAWGEISRTIAGNDGPAYAYPLDTPGRIPTQPGFARTGLQEGEDTRGGISYVLPEAVEDEITVR